MRTFSRVSRIPILFLAILVSSSYADEPQHILSGISDNGKKWDLIVNCHQESGVEVLVGDLKIDDELVTAGQKLEMIKTNIGLIKYFGAETKTGQNVVGWYFEGWPQTCSHLPK